MLDLFNVLACGNDEFACETVLGEGIPGNIVNIVYYVYLGIQIVVPIILIIFGMLDLAKSLAAQKEDEIKKAQSGLLKKAVTAILVFLIFSLVKFVFGFAGGNEGAWGCVDDLLHAECTSSAETSKR